MALLLSVPVPVFACAPLAANETERKLLTALFHASLNRTVILYMLYPEEVIGGRHCCRRVEWLDESFRVAIFLSLSISSVGGFEKMCDQVRASLSPSAHYLLLHIYLYEGSVSQEPEHTIQLAVVSIAYLPVWRKE